MEFMAWLGAAALAAAAGVSLVNYLTAHPLRMRLHLLALCLAVFALVAVVATQFQGARMLFAVPISLASFAAGYAARTGAVLAQRDTRRVPRLERAPDGPGEGHVAVVYFTHGEPQTYSPAGWLNQFREFDAQGIPFVPVLARPIFIFRLRQAYLRVGHSRHRPMHLRMARRLEEALRADGYADVKVYPSFLDDEPRPDAAVIQALNEGACQIVVAEVFVSISNHTLEGEELIRRVDAGKCGVPVRFSGPLWDSQTLCRMFLDKANAASAAADRSKVGVLLVGHGQPDAWDKEFPTETEHEIRFRQNVLDLLAVNGYRRENIGLAWMEFKRPRPVEKAEEMLANGIERLLVFSAAISADSIHSQYDIPELVRKARVPDGFLIINLGAWNDHPLAIEAIKEKVAPLLAAGATAAGRKPSG